MNKAKMNRKSLGTILKRLAASGLCLAIIGCSGGPAAVEVPSFDPEEAAEQALAIYDTDKDGFVAGEELEKAPGLNAAIKTLDTNGDTKISGEEIAARMSALNEMRIGLMTITCQVTLDGQPLDNAVVSFVPEEFLGGVIQEASGTTAGTGEAYPKIPKEKRPSPDSPPGIQAGIYKVVISKKNGDQETIPARYNTETILGQQVSRDDRAIASKRVMFNLTSK